jgi:hypothetical protein
MREVIEKLDGSTGGSGADDAWLYVTLIHEPGDMARKARRGLQEELQVLAKQVEDFKTGAKKTRPDTLRRRLEEFDALRNKIDMYASLLKFKSEDLVQASRDMDAAVEVLLAGDDEESEAA